MTALGLIETKGCLAAIEAADAMLKAADVRLLEKNLVGGGLVTITVAGEVSAVQAAVDAAVASVARIAGAELVAGHVIARPDEELVCILSFEPLEQLETPFEDAAHYTPDSMPTDGILEQAAKPEPKLGDVFKLHGLERHDPAQLKTMSLSRLRQIAHKLAELSVPGILAHEKISSADKKMLIEAIVHIYRQIEE